MGVNKVESKIAGCFQVFFSNILDQRGSFVKTYQNALYKDLGISMELAEEYISYSKKNVFRGLHFQLSPKALDKMVFCVCGNVIDYVVDLRKNSITYGDYVSFELSDKNPSAIFIPKGLAHGFYVKSDNAVMQYKVSEVYDPELDSGISYSTFDFARDIPNPIISERDSNFKTIDAFETPFNF
jgi:dTDP-4-dehydrorhamnose 3,5-epimerase